MKKKWKKGDLAKYGNQTSRILDIFDVPGYKKQAWIGIVVPTSKLKKIV